MRSEEIYELCRKRDQFIEFLTPQSSFLSPHQTHYRAGPKRDSRSVALAMAMTVSITAVAFVESPDR